MRDYLKQQLIRLKHWEYWNSGIIYLPVFPYLLFLMIKRRDPFFFIAANPGIENGGFTLESKWKIQDQMQHKWFPETRLILKSTAPDQIREQIRDIQFPCYLKPDIGGKGRGVVQIQSMDELIEYHAHCPINFLVQEKIPYPLEIGVFFIKNPLDSSGTISGIVLKEYICLTGDGTSTIAELLRSNPRYFLQFNRLKKAYPEKLTQIPGKGEQEILSEIGNHALGSAFRDCSNQITPALTDLINELASELPDFYFGRFDIRFNSWEELNRGEQFAIVELNGAGSEPTHIYDSSHSLFFAWSEIIRHWKAMSEISGIINEQQKRKIRLVDGIRLLINHRRMMKKLDHFSGSIQTENA